jgi:hypothetical protein
MNLFVRSLTATLTGLILAAATASAADKPPKADAPPPPGINDPGVVTPTTPTSADAASAAPVADEDPLAPLQKPDSRLVRDKASRENTPSAERIAASEVTRRKQGTDTVEEYRDSGHVWMIKIVPQNGPTQTFMDNDGRGGLNRNPLEGPISPVYYTLYEWK